MSTAGGVTVEVAPHAYFCYQCNRTVNLTPSPFFDLSCPNCYGGFLEELDSNSSPNPNPNPNPNPFDPFSLLSDPFFAAASGGGHGGGPILVSSTTTTIDLGNPRNFSTFLSPSSTTAFNPFDFLQSYLHNLRENGANVQFVIENHNHNHNHPSDFGDYFLGPGLEQLIQQLAENDPNRYGTPPASKRAVEGLPNIAITEELLNSDSNSNSCAVCMNEFDVGSLAKQMPCKHLFHSGCLLPWLELHNSCPVCRYELPTDDSDYEARKANGGQGTSSGAASGSGGGQSQGVGNGNGNGSGNVERRFRISLPWPFSVFASSGGNNDGGNNSNDDNNGGSNSGSGSGVQQSGSHGSEPRQENLD